MPSRILLLALCLSVGIPACWLLNYGPSEIVQGPLLKIPNDLPLLKENLKENQLAPFRWVEAAEQFAAAGEMDKAKGAFLQAQKMGPEIPAIWVRTANFYFLQNQPEAGIEAVSKVLKITSANDDFVFVYFDQFAPSRDHVYRAILDNRRASRSYLSYLMARSRGEEAFSMWDQNSQRGYIDRPLLVQYLEFLIKQQQFQQAVKLWAASLTPEQRGDYPTLNMIYNPGFEQSPSGSVLDWVIQPMETVETSLSSTQIKTGKQSLRVQFPGTSNIDFHHVSQVVSIPVAGNYGFKAMLKMEGITTDQGVRFCFEDAATAGKFRFQTEPLRGTSEWIPVTANLAIPSATRGLRISICRSASLKFDNKVSGTFWVDDVSLRSGVAY